MKKLLKRISILTFIALFALGSVSAFAATSLSGTAVKGGSSSAVSISGKTKATVFKIGKSISDYSDSTVLSDGGTQNAIRAILDGNGSSILGEITTTFQIKAARTGYMKFYVKDFSSFDGTYYYFSQDKASYAYVTVYNSSKKAVTSRRYCTGQTFGVKKGSTYYVKVEQPSSYTSYNYDYEGSTYNAKGYSVGCKSYAATDRSLSKKSKAKGIKRKKYVSSLFVASTGSSVDWYKIKVTKKRKTVIKLYLTNMSKSGCISVKVYKGKKKLGSATINCAYYSSWSGKLTYGRTYGKANKGTYYIKVTKSPKASGKYTIKYVQ